MATQVQQVTVAAGQPQQVVFKNLKRIFILGVSIAVSSIIVQNYQEKLHILLNFFLRYLKQFTVYWSRHLESSY